MYKDKEVKNVKNFFDQIKFTGVETVINTHVYPEYSLI